MDNSWRVIDTGACGAAFNMALDEAIAITVREGLSAPTLRLYGWSQVSVSIGCFQRSADINVGYCRENGIPIVRRATGGRAVCHHDEITYSFSTQTKTGLFSHGLFDSYKKISAALKDALSFVGISTQREPRKRSLNMSVLSPAVHDPLCFRSASYGEISVDEIKVIGSAQKRWTDGLLQQGSIPFVVDNTRVSKIFPRDELHAARKPLVGLKQLLPSLSYDEMRNAIQVAFEKTFQIRLVPSDPSRQEMLLSKELEEQKYLNDAWSFRK